MVSGTFASTVHRCIVEFFVPGLEEATEGRCQCKGISLWRSGRKLQKKLGFQCQNDQGSKTGSNTQVPLTTQIHSLNSLSLSFLIHKMRSIVLFLNENLHAKYPSHSKFSINCSCNYHLIFLWLQKICFLRGKDLNFRNPKV